MQMLFIGYGLVWVVLFGYMIYMHRQQQGLQKELTLLREVVNRSVKG